MSHKDSFKKRNKSFTAENKCVEFLNNNNILYTRYGFDALFDIPWQKFNMIPEKLRCTPDYMILHTKATLLEVKGCSNILRLKQLDMEAYDFWASMVELNMFIYSTLNRTHKIINYAKLKSIAVNCETDMYPENKKVYYRIPWELIDAK